MSADKKKSAEATPSLVPETGTTVLINSHGLHRSLNNRQIQLIAAGGAIGTALFISIGEALAKGGPANLLLAFTLYASVLAMVNNSIAEMTTFMPVEGGFMRLAGHWVDDALGFMAGWNFFFYEAFAIPFEITALNLAMSFWSEEVTRPGPTAGVCAGVVVCYALLNIAAVRLYGESEFWLSGGKIILIFILFAFTFVTMVGGNPQGDAYGFRYWTTPGAFAEFYTQGSLGRFEGFLACSWSAAFTVVGPEFISMVASEAKHPRMYIKAAFKTVYFRLCLFFVLGALAVGVVIPYNHPVLVDIYFGSGSSATASSSPYVIAMTDLGITVLPHIVNALIMTSMFSAGNTYIYCATRTLHSLALEGRAPSFLRHCTKNGVPIYCFCMVMVFPLLSFLQVSSSSAQVITWLISLITGGAMINYLVMSVTFLQYYRACKAQGFDRKALPYYGYFQPYGAYIAIFVQGIVFLFAGYRSISPWDATGFVTNYMMQMLAPVLFFGWKIWKRTSYVRPENVDLVWEGPVVDAYEAGCVDAPKTFWQEMGELVGLRKRETAPASTYLGR
ncbi:hypothetical protein BDW74DRAFT_174101 [Aspergillus multicolor]|uniref:uncharacterized protein n=1 Tax=Aspergillus multicolor TaxID=41759 RepID=UPI003CCD4518